MSHFGQVFLRFHFNKIKMYHIILISLVFDLAIIITQISQIEDIGLISKILKTFKIF